MARTPGDNEGFKRLVAIVFVILLIQAVLEALTELVRLLLVVGACGALGWIVQWTAGRVFDAWHRRGREPSDDPPQR